MSKISRRNLVTSAAALPALALPAFTSEAIGPNHPDAELLRLGVELEAIAVEWHTQRAIDRKQSAAVHAALEAAGLSDIDHHRGLPDDKFRAYLAKRDAVTQPIYRASGDVNEAGESIAWNDIHGRMWPMIDVILEHKAQTVAGFAVQVRAMSLSYAELWDGEPEEGENHRQFIEAAGAFAGVVPVPLDAEAVQS